jgi:hypothetical protein
MIQGGELARIIVGQGTFPHNGSITEAVHALSGSVEFRYEIRAC